MLLQVNLKKEKKSFKAENTAEKPEICYYLHRCPRTNVRLDYYEVHGCSAATSSTHGKWAAIENMRKCCLPLLKG